MKLDSRNKKLVKVESNIWYDKERNVYRVHMGYNRKYFDGCAEDIEYNTYEQARDSLKEIRDIVAQNKMTKLRRIALEKELEEIKKLDDHPFPFNALEITMSEEEITNIPLSLIDDVEKLIMNSDVIKPRELDCFLKHFRDGITLEEIGKQLEVSRERVRQLCWLACKKLKHLILNYDKMVERERKLQQEKEQMEKLEEHRREIIEIFRQSGVYNEDMVIEFGTVEVCPSESSYLKQTLNTTIEEMDLSVRSFNCLRRAGIQTLEDLTKHTENEMYKVRNLGKKSLREIKEKLLGFGLSFKDEE